MFHTKALIKALQFLCLPTLSFLVVLYVWFFDWAKFSAFVTSDNGWASFLRVLVLILEFILVYVMYVHYENTLPNDKYITKLKDGILGEDFELIGSGHVTDGGSRKSTYSDEIDRNLRQIQIPSDKYRLKYFKIKGIEDCLIIKPIIENEH